MTSSRPTSSISGPGPGLFVVLPAESARRDVADCIQAFLCGVHVAALLLPPLSETGSVERMEEICALAQHAGTAVLTHDVADCRALQADGVHLRTRDGREVARLRRQLGMDAIVGACCPGRRHLAMEMGEAGADYLGIDQRLEAGGENLLAWWAEMFTVPVVAMHPVAPQEAPRVVRLGADFLVPSPEIWHSAEDAERLAAEWARLLGQRQDGGG